MSEHSNTSSAPIFVVGAPRSGNTLLGFILNKHDDLVIFLEQESFYSMRSVWEGYRQRGVEPCEAMIETFFEEEDGWIEQLTSLEFDREQMLEELRGLEPGSDWGAMFDTFERMLARRIKPDVKRWGDKSPRNVAALSDIIETYPDAQILYVYRDPRDVVTSMTNPAFTPASDNRLVCAELVRLYWRVYQAEKSLIPDENVLEVCYDDLVDAPEPKLRDVCDFLGIDYTPELLETAEADVRRKIGRPESKAWGPIEPQPSSERSADGDLVEAMLLEHLVRLGYEESRDIVPVKRQMAAELAGFPFRMIRSGLEVVWRRRYPDRHHFLLHHYPKLNDYMRWLGQEAGARKER